MGFISHISSSSEDASDSHQGKLLLYMGKMDPLTGYTDDVNLETIKVDHNRIFQEMVGLNINPLYWVRSREEIHTRLINPISHEQYSDRTAEIAPILHHAFLIFHLINENNNLPNLYVSMERQRNGIIMQVSCEKETVLKLQGIPRQGDMTKLEQKPMDLSFLQLTEILYRENYLDTTYNLAMNNCQVFVKNINRVIDEEMNRLNE